MRFEFSRIVLHFRAVSTIQFPEGRAGNVLRGALGWILRDTPDYEKLFAPIASGPSGLRNPPRPFVFRAANLNGGTVAPGERFQFQINVFSNAGASFVGAFAKWSGRAQLLDAITEFVSIDLAPGDPIQEITVSFVTPTELKSANELAPEPLFSILLARAQDRVSTLSALYGPGPLPIDFASMRERAANISITRREIASASRLRRSSRTGQVHPLGGFTGIVHYAGDLTEFLPVLTAAQHTGVGRQTVWGNGEICLV